MRRLLPLASGIATGLLAGGINVAVNVHAGPPTASERSLATPAAMSVKAPVIAIVSTPQVAPAAMPVATLDPALVTAPVIKLRVMSFNIRYGDAADGENAWENRQDLLREAVESFEPDILGTQECLAFQARYLEEAFPRFAWVGVGRDDGRLGGEMCAIFYDRQRFTKLKEGQFWLSETPAVVASKSWDAALTRMVSWVALCVMAGASRTAAAGADTIYVFNTHFDHQGVQARTYSASLLSRRMQEIRQEHPAILMGDFNAPADTLSSGPYGIMLAAGVDDGEPLVDTYRRRHSVPTNAEGTYHAFAGRVDGPRIDWLLVTPDFEVREADIEHWQQGGHYPSDHFPVTAVLHLERIK